MSAKRGVIYLDFDRTLFDVDAMMRPVKAFLLSHVSESAYQAAYQVAKQGGYSFERHLDGLDLSDEKRHVALSLFMMRTQLGDQLLFSDVVSTLAALQMDFDLRLLTFGDPVLQKRKFFSCQVLSAFFSELHFVNPPLAKTDILSQLVSEELPIFFLDDSVQELQDARKQAPEVVSVQIARLGASQQVGEIPLGSDWPIVPDLSTFQAFLYESLES